MMREMLLILALSVVISIAVASNRAAAKAEADPSRPKEQFEFVHAAANAIYIARDNSAGQEFLLYADCFDGGGCLLGWRQIGAASWTSGR